MLKSAADLHSNLHCSWGRSAKMNRFKNHLIVAAVFALLWGIGTIMNSHQAAAQGPPGGMSVNIVNPLPVPVTGSTTVSGTVSATQSGAWTVGIAGTPNVNVTGLPAVTLAGGASVNVANTSANPVPILDVDSAVRHAYQSHVQMANRCTGQICSFVFAAPQAGHRLVVEHIAGVISLQNVSSQIGISVVNQSASLLANVLAPAPPPSFLYTQFDQPVLFYIDQQQSFSVGVVLPQGGSFLPFDSQEITLAGHLVDCSVVPCAPIAQ
jgi:hypothetical protein